jgi:hypothetical protein
VEREKIDVQQIVNQAASYLPESQIVAAKALIQEANGIAAFSQVKQSENAVGLEVSILTEFSLYDVVVGKDRLSRGWLFVDRIDLCHLEETPAAVDVYLTAGSAQVSYQATEPQKREQLKVFISKVVALRDEHSSLQRQKNVSHSS